MINNKECNQQFRQDQLAIENQIKKIQNGDNTLEQIDSLTQNEFYQFLDLLDQTLLNRQDTTYIKNYVNLKYDFLPDLSQIKSIYISVQKRIKIGKSHLIQKLKKNWSNQENMLYAWIITKYFDHYQSNLKQIKTSDWEYISSLIPGKSIQQCKQKWLQMQKNYIQSQPWTKQEDLCLLQIIIYNCIHQFNLCFLKNKIRQKGTIKWTEIAKCLNQSMKSEIFRAGKQCRERWNNHLNPYLKRGPWNSQDDANLMQNVILLGKKWSEISKKMQGRTENSVKNRFNSLMKKYCQDNEKPYQIFNNFNFRLNSKEMNIALHIVQKHNLDSLNSIKDILIVPKILNQIQQSLLEYDKTLRKQSCPMFLENSPQSSENEEKNQQRIHRKSVHISSDSAFSVCKRTCVI